MTAYPTLRAAGATDIGRVRAVNEDSFTMLPSVAIVADGMGGHACGDVASGLAVQTFETFFAQGPIRPTDVVDAVLEANATIVAEAERHPDKAGMGTTITGIALVDLDGTPMWLVVNVGDSRVYRLSPAGLTQVTKDHSEVAELISIGAITAEEARTHPLRNVITQSLGTTPPPRADTTMLPVAPDDLFLLCSDGLTGELTDPEILDIARRTLGSGGSLDNLARRLVDAAVAAGGRDNVTVVLVTAPPGLATETSTASTGEDETPTGAARA